VPEKLDPSTRLALNIVSEKNVGEKECVQFAARLLLGYLVVTEFPKPSVMGTPFEEGW
jgi:hypothetical protein